MQQDDKNKENQQDTQQELEHPANESASQDLPVSEEEKAEVDETEKTKKELDEFKDKYLRLYSEFENFRRRTAKEKTELVKTANEDVIVSLLTVLDDFERAQKSFSTTSEADPVKEGVNLIYNKLFKTLESKGLKAMDTPPGEEFNSELHEAITQIPAPAEDLKGKIVDTVEKGYYLHDKVIRFAKVVIGA